MTTVRDRFAPSPTGFLHIGGVRTALFNWLFARHHGGQYILRIDDTDQERNVEAALAPILHGFRWLGLEWDEGPEVGGPHAPYFQSQRTARYQAAVDQLLAVGARLSRLRQARRDGRASARRPRRRSGSSSTAVAGWPRRDEDRARFEAEGRKWVVRLKMPRAGQAACCPTWCAATSSSQWAQEADHVIQRGDGSFIYHLANVVDDRDFEITHVIRAEEHLSNTPRQVFMVQALGYPAAGVRAPALRRRAGLEAQAVQAQARRST